MEFKTEELEGNQQDNLMEGTSGRLTSTLMRNQMSYQNYKVQLKNPVPFTNHTAVSPPTTRHLWLWTVHAPLLIPCRIQCQKRLLQHSNVSCHSIHLAELRVAEPELEFLLLLLHFPWNRQFHYESVTMDVHLRCIRWVHLRSRTRGVCCSIESARCLRLPRHRSRITSGQL